MAQNLYGSVGLSVNVYVFISTVGTVEPRADAAHDTTMAKEDYSAARPGGEGLDLARCPSQLPPERS